MRQQKTLREGIEGRIVRKRGEDVFLTREFRDLGGEDQVLRVLRGLVRDPDEPERGTRAAVKESR
jgi:hypothetical protein